jgi:hypothetical protein
MHFISAKHGLITAVTPFLISLCRVCPAPDVAAWQQVQKATTVCCRASRIELDSAVPGGTGVLNIIATEKQQEAPRVRSPVSTESQTRNAELTELGCVSSLVSTARRSHR